MASIEVDFNPEDYLDEVSTDAMVRTIERRGEVKELPLILRKADVKKQLQEIEQHLLNTGKRAYAQQITDIQRTYFA